MGKQNKTNQEDGRGAGVERRYTHEMDETNGSTSMRHPCEVRARHPMEGQLEKMQTTNEEKEET